MVEKPFLEWDNHSNYTVFTDLEDEVFVDMPCYSSLWSGYPGMTALKLWFPEDCDVHRIEEYVEWVINSELFGDAFLTKNYKEGIENGFDIDIDQPTNYLFMCFAAIRFPYECQIFDKFCWGNFRDDGFTEIESLFLTTRYSLNGSGKELVRQNYNSNHKPIPATVPLEKYSYKFFTKQVGTMRDCAASTGVTGSWEYGRDCVFDFDRSKYDPEALKKEIRKQEEMA